MKVNIEDVFSAFQEYQNEARRAGINAALHHEARTKFKEKLDGWGLGQLIDWTDKS